MQTFSSDVYRIRAQTRLQQAIIFNVLSLVQVSLIHVQFVPSLDTPTGRARFPAHVSHLRPALRVHSPRLLGSDDDHHP